MPEAAVLTVHNRYQQPGGEDQVFASEGALLGRHGHRVVRYEEDNARIGLGATAAIAGVWNARAAREIGDMVRQQKPDVVHFHNTFPLISPAAYYAVRREGVPVVQTLHNYRLLCPGATLFRDGAVCEQCIEQRSLRPAMAHKCYRGSRPATAAVSVMLTVHRAARTWQRKVDLYIALSEFARRKLIQGGLPERRIAVKPNFVWPDPGVGAGGGGYALFVGRLSAEKGISVLAEAWKELTDIPLVVAGEGPMAEVFGKPLPAVTEQSDSERPDSERPDSEQLAGVSGTVLVGLQTREKVFELMRNARVLIVPSIWYEGEPMTIIEAFACGLPVIASNLGSMAEIVDHGRTGLLFTAGDAADLARTVRSAFANMADMRAAARREFEEKYTAERNYQLLTAIYERAIADAS